MRMPTSRNESYRFTDVAPIMAQSFEVNHEFQPTAICCTANHPLAPCVSASLHSILTHIKGHSALAMHATTIRRFVANLPDDRFNMSVSLSLLQMPNGSGVKDTVTEHPLEEASTSQLVIVDGIPSLELSNLSNMPDDVYVGGIQHAPSQVVSQQLVS